MDANLSPCKGKSFKIKAIHKAFALTGRLVDWPLYPGRCPGLRASAPTGRAGYFQHHRSKIFLLLKLLELLQACKGHFLCFWSCCRLARVTFFAFEAVASLQGSLFVLLRLLQACKGHFLCFWSCCKLARVTFCAFGAVASLQGLLFLLLRLLQACKGYFLCFWSCCRLARVTFCAFGAVAGLQGSLFLLLRLLQVTFRCKSDKKRLSKSNSTGKIHIFIVL